MGVNVCAVAVVALLCAGGPAAACLTGLVVIPTAEVLGDGQYGVELQFDGATSALQTDTYIANTEIGIGDRFEAGLDYDASEAANPKYMINAKYLLAMAPDGRWAAAAGLDGVARNAKPAPYVAGLRDFGLVRAHLGAIRIESRSFWFVGLDHAVSERLTLMADHVSGMENSSSVGVNYQFSKTTGFMAGFIFPNSGWDSRFTLHLVFGGSYR